MKKQWISVGVVAVLAISMLAGCKDDSAGKEKINVKDDSVKKYYELTGSEEDKDIEVTWCVIGGKDEYYQNYWKEMSGLRAIQQITGVNIDFQVKVSYDDYVQMFTAKNYPDVITANNLSKYPGRMAGMYTDKVSVRLNEYMDDWMPNFSSIVENFPQIAQDIRLDDGTYSYVGAFFDVTDEKDRISSSEFGLAIRKDWLNAMGYEKVPETMDEWYNVLLDFKRNDPNGNGQQDEEPVCLASSAWKYFLPAYGIDDDPSILVDENGNETVIYGYITENYKQYLEEFRKWNADGLIYNMFENTSLEKRDEKVLGNLAGAWKGEAQHFDESNDSSYISKLREIVPEAEFAACPWPKTATGYQWCFADINSCSTDSTVITAKAVEHKTDKAAAYVIDYMLGENGSTLLTWGIEGESYEVKNGQKVLKEGMEDKVQFYDKSLPKKYTYADPITVMFPQFGELSDYLKSCQTDEYNNACEVWAKGDTSYKLSAACQLNVDQIREVNDMEDNMKNYIRKMRQNFIVGKAPLTEFDTYVAQVRQLGADKYIEVWTQAYENYKTR